MSYRAFKRLLGETSLERKCRFLFGAGILVLITASFWLYAYQTEHLAYDQTANTCRALVDPVFEKWHLSYVLDRQEKRLAPESKDQAQKLIDLIQQLRQARTEADSLLVEKLGRYQYRLLRENQPFEDSYERELFKEFQKGDGPKNEDTRLRADDKLLLYYAAV